MSVARTAPQCGEETFAPAAATNAYGINSNALYQLTYIDSTPDASYRSVATLLREANLGWVRLDFSWGPLIAHDAYKSDTSQISWTLMDADVDRAVCRGINVLGILAYTPEWAVNRFQGPVYDVNVDSGPLMGPGPHYHVPGSIQGRLLPDNMTKWDEFVRAAVTRYPEIKYWSIWNEPNSPGFFRGNDPSDTQGTLSNIVPAYDTLVAHAAPWIRNNPDGKGPRFLVAPELGGGSNSAEFLRRVVQDEGANIDVVAVHAYGQAGDIVNYLRTLHSSGPLSSWPGEVWLTEAGPIGCNDLQPGNRPSYCVGTGQGHIDDGYQASHLNDLISGMGAPASSSAHWTKTFYWHSHQETVDDPAHNTSVGDDRGILHGARAGNVYGRPAYTAYGTIAGPPVMGGSVYASDENADVGANPAVPGPAYYYVWEYTWCANTGNAEDCPAGSGQWYGYTEGTANTVSPYVDESDFYLHMRARQYAWQGGPQIAVGTWDIQGQGKAAASCGTQVICDGSGGGVGAAHTAKTGAAKSDAATTSGASVAKMHYAPSSAERRKGIGHAGNR